MSSILIKNVKEIITMDSERTRLKSCSLLIEDNKISKIACNIKSPPFLSNLNQKYSSSTECRAI